MLERESWGSGWQVRLRARGVARFAAAAFLGVWLCGWAVGEFFAGTTFIAGLGTLLDPDLRFSWLPRMKNATPQLAVPMLLFLAVWLAGWTAGGLLAMREFTRALVGVDRVRWDHETLEVLQSAGPLAWRRSVRWSEVTEILAQRPSSVVAHTRKGLWRVTGFVTRDESHELRDALVAAWRQGRGAELELAASGDAAPAGWVVETADDGRPMLVSDPRARRAWAVLLAGIAAFLAIVAVNVGLAAAEAGAWAGAAVLAALALIAGAGAAWTGLGRVELRPSPRSLRRVTRLLGREWSKDLSTVRLALESSRDSDGDDRWELVATGAEGRLTLASDLHVPGAARHMGLWLARRMSVELEGRPEAEGAHRRAS